MSEAIPTNPTFAGIEDSCISNGLDQRKEGPFRLHPNVGRSDLWRDLFRTDDDRAVNLIGRQMNSAVEFVRTNLDFHDGSPRFESFGLIRCGQRYLNNGFVQ